MKPKKGTYVFVTNLIETRDVDLRGIYPRLGPCLSDKIWEKIFLNVFGKKQFGSFGYKLVSRYKISDDVDGAIVLVMLSAQQMWKHKLHARYRVLEACRYAQNKLGASVISLGSLSKSITSEGAWLQKQGITTPITHGDSYTVASSFEGVKKVAKLHCLEKPFSIAILGSYGKIGSALAELLDKNGYKVVAMGRNKDKLLQMFKERGLSSQTVLTTSLKEAINSADLVVGTVSSPYSIIDENCLERDKPYIVYDIGQPNNLDRENHDSLLAKGFKIYRYDGAFVQLTDRNIDIGFWMRLRPYISYACFVEGMLQALAGEKNHHLGKVDLDYVEKTSQWADDFGFYHAELSNFLQKPLMGV